ncbi:MAG: FAD-dependent oxidoreductase [Clostridia bacterium]|nr:FAD-dependent oxidoreductase [Clostridia bacterium]
MYNMQISKKERYDIVVCGGGFSGFSAAYSAAREGARVLLVEKNGCLGGVGTAGLVNHMLGARLYDDGKIYQSIAGIYKTLEERMLLEKSAVDFRTVDLSLNPHGWYPSLGTGLVFDGEKMKLVLEAMLEEVGCKILYFTDVISAQCKDGNVSGIMVHNKSGTYIIEAKAFVDATGDADICRYCGCGFEKGDENGGMAAASLEMHVENVDAGILSKYMKDTEDFRFRKIIAQLKETGEWDFPYEIFISVKLCSEDTFMINTIRQVGIDGTDAESLSRGIIDGRRENYKLLEIMRKYFPGFSEARICRVAPVIGIRETVRIVGEYTLLVEDLVNGTEFSDTIAISSYGWDLPNPKKPSLQPFHDVKRRSPHTCIPYRCLVPRDAENIIAVGRCVSVEREVLGPVRVMAPCVAMGEAAGIAAVMAANDGISFKNINVDLLRNKLRGYGAMVDIGNIMEV